MKVSAKSASGLAHTPCKASAKLPAFLSALVVLISANSGAPVAAQAAAPLPIYTCKDQYGRNLKSDRYIAECAGREQSILNADGSVKHRVLSDEDQAKLDAATRKQREDLANLAEQRRRERVLVQRYPSIEVWERLMLESLAGPVSIWEGAIDRIRGTNKVIKELQDEAEFYKKGNFPAALKSKMEQTQFAIDAERRLIDQQRDEIARIQARYTQDLIKMHKLWAEQAAQK
jgi:hypothetical protein